jgi:hypothetical protein
MLSSVVASLLLTTVLFAPPQTLAADCTSSTFGLLATSPTVSLCMQDSKIPLLTMGSSPTPEQLRVVCSTATCRQLLQELVDLHAVECTIPLAGRLRLHADLIDPAVAYCTQVDLSHGSSRSGDGSEQGLIKEGDPTARLPRPASESNQLSVSAKTGVLVSTVVTLVYLLD